MFQRKLAALAAAALCWVGVSAGAASAAYIDPVVEVQVNPTTLVGGGSIDGYAEANVECDWTVTFRGEEQTDVGTRIDFEFDTPEVDEETEHDLEVVCAYDDAQLSDAAAVRGGSEDAHHAGYVIADASTAVLPTAIQEIARTVTITLLAEDDDDDDDDDDDGSSSSGASGSDLPSAGGPDLGWVYGGVALVLVGATTVIVLRRRTGSEA